MAYYNERERGVLARSPLLNRFLDLSVPKVDVIGWSNELMQIARPYRASMEKLLSPMGYVTLVNGFTNVSMSTGLFAPGLREKLIEDQAEVLLSMGFEVGDPQDCISFNHKIVIQLASARVLNPYIVAGNAETFGQGSAVLSSMIYTGAQLKYGVDHHYSSHRVVQEGYPELSLFRGVIDDLDGLEDLGKGQNQE